LILIGSPCLQPRAVIRTAADFKPDLPARQESSEPVRQLEIHWSGIGL